MWWVLVVIAQFIVIAAGIRDEERAGLWSWSKFFFAIGFAALECIVLIVPITYIHDVHSRYFIPGLCRLMDRCCSELHLDDHRCAPLEASRRPYQPSGLPRSAAVRNAT
jgi:hypothetical protein